jgi:hypothetical protein
MISGVTELTVLITRSSMYQLLRHGFDRTVPNVSKRPFHFKYKQASSFINSMMVLSTSHFRAKGIRIQQREQAQFLNLLLFFRRSNVVPLVSQCSLSHLRQILTNLTRSPSAETMTES